ncbi:uncharacterized protein LOC134278740 [Saccostrea cucullata]|uniref:uncharacterized protein LOC134278740 n=1 Tax=Saccostrea cuccullata TaxID=36930 RepID=UPI002ED29197
MVRPLQSEWMIFTGKQYIIEDILQYNSTKIRVVDYKENGTRVFYNIQVQVIESKEGDTKNISWTNDAFPLSKMYELTHTYDDLQRPILSANEDYITIYDPSKYAYPKSTFDFGNARLQIRNITTRDAGFYSGCTVNNESWCGGGVVLVVKGNPTKPRITGNLTRKTGQNASVFCFSKSTSVPSYYKEFPPLSFMWYINNTLVGETTGNIYRFTIEKGDKHSYVTCQAKETLMSVKSERLQIIPLYGPDERDMKISPPISGNITLQENDIFGPYACAVDCNPPCSIQWKNMDPSGKFVSITTKGQTFKLLPPLRVRRSKHGLFQCIAEGLDGKMETITIKLDIQYMSTPKVYINGVAAANVTDIPENEPLQISCLVEGNPVPAVTISRDRGNHLLETSVDQWLNYTSITEVQCADTDTYRCTGTSKENPSKSTTFIINIVCKPRLDNLFEFKSTYQVENLPTVITVEVPVISNPKPISVKWLGLVPTESFYTKISKGKDFYHYWIYSTIPIYNDSFLGNYTLFADDVDLANIKIIEVKSSFPVSVLIQREVWISFIGALAFMSILVTVVIIIRKSPYGRQTTQPQVGEQTVNTENPPTYDNTLEPREVGGSSGEYETLPFGEPEKTQKTKSGQFMMGRSNDNKDQGNIYENLQSTKKSL